MRGRHRGRAQYQSAEDHSDDQWGPGGGQGQLTARRADHVDGGNRTEQADTEVSPERELVAERQRLGWSEVEHEWRFNSGRMGRTLDGRRHGELPTPALPGQVQA